MGNQTTKQEAAKFSVLMQQQAQQQSQQQHLHPSQQQTSIHQLSYKYSNSNNIVFPTTSISNHVDHHVISGNTANGHNDVLKNTDDHNANAHSLYQSMNAPTSDVVPNVIVKTENTGLVMDNNDKPSPVDYLPTNKQFSPKLTSPHSLNTYINGTQFYKNRLIAEGDELPEKITTDNKIERPRTSTSNADDFYEPRPNMQVTQWIGRSTIPRKFDTYPLQPNNTKRIGLDATSQHDLSGSATMHTENKTSKIEANTEIVKPQIMNGIETNPDMVRNLLKESLGISSGFLKSTILSPTLEPPEQLLQIKSDESVATEIEDDACISPTNTDLPNLIKPEVNNVATDGVSKGDKKKKKEKHKHKDKDKSKDRSDRKKHKKEKDRCIETDDGMEKPVRIKISREGGGDINEPGKLKIKIPKDVLSPNDLNALRSSSNANGSSGIVSQEPQMPLRIKICKDKLENYNAGPSVGKAGGHYSHQRAGYTIARPVEKQKPILTLTTTSKAANVSDTKAARKRTRQPDRDSIKSKGKRKRIAPPQTTALSPAKGKPKMGTKSKQVW